MSYEDIGLPINDNKIACLEAGFSFGNPKIIAKIFGNNKPKGCSSYTWLRNKILHELMDRALAEVCERYKEAINDMNELI